MDGDDDRAAILAGRRRSIVLVLSGLFVGGCGPGRASASTPPRDRDEAAYARAIGYGRMSTYEPVMAQPAEPVEFSDRPAWESELRLEQCGVRSDLVRGFRAESTSGGGQATKAIFELAQQAREAGDLVCALELLEQVGFVLSKPGVWLEVAELALALDDCRKGHAYLRHLEAHADPRRHADELARAAELLAGLDPGCAPEPVPSKPQPPPVPPR